MSASCARALRHWALVVSLGPALVLACGGGTREPRGARRRATSSSVSAPASSAPVPTPLASASAIAPPPKAAPPSKAARWTWSAIGCWVGGAWSEALGALGEERLLATTKRCRTVAVEALGASPTDDATVTAVRSVDPKAVERVVSAVSDAAAGSPEQGPLVSLVRAVGDAAREAMLARRAADGVRKAPASKQAQALNDATPILSAKDALARLHGLAEGPLAPAAEAISLVIAADHVESARGLDPRAKIVAAAPAFEVVFGVDRPAGADWLAYLEAAAAAAGHPTDAKGSPEERETSAFVAVVEGFADRLEAAAARLGPGDVKDATAGYARRLRLELAEAAERAKPGAASGAQ